jgi:hypothetical protein
MHKNATKCNKTLGKWCKNKHGASKIIDTFETYQGAPPTGVYRSVLGAKLGQWHLRADCEEGGGSQEAGWAGLSGRVGAQNPSKHIFLLP